MSTASEPDRATKPGSRDAEEPKGNVGSPAQADKEPKPWSSREMEEAEPYPLPEVPDEGIEDPCRARKRETTDDADKQGGDR